MLQASLALFSFAVGRRYERRRAVASFRRFTPLLLETVRQWNQHGYHTAYRHIRSGALQQASAEQMEDVRETYFIEVGEHLHELEEALQGLPGGLPAEEG
jgi:hypothetical protein